MKFLILNFFIKALLNATYEINPIDYSHKTVAHYNTYHTSITEWSILKPLITVLRTWYILPVHYISVQYSHSNSTPYMDTLNCPVMSPPFMKSLFIYFSSIFFSEKKRLGRVLKGVWRVLKGVWRVFEQK